MVLNLTRRVVGSCCRLCDSGGVKLQQNTSKKPGFFSFPRASSSHLSAYLLYTISYQCCPFVVQCRCTRVRGELRMQPIPAYGVCTLPFGCIHRFYPPLQQYHEISKLTWDVSVYWIQHIVVWTIWQWLLWVFLKNLSCSMLGSIEYIGTETRYYLLLVTPR
jgi:hypothetical protein